METRPFQRIYNHKYRAKLGNLLYIKTPAWFMENGCIGMEWYMGRERPVSYKWRKLF